MNHYLVPKHMRSVKSDGTLGNSYDPNKLFNALKNGKWEAPIKWYE